MNGATVLRESELEVFAVEGVVVLDRPLTWEMVGELLAVLERTAAPAAD